jgi:hypothetical protein
MRATAAAIVACLFLATAGCGGGAGEAGSSGTTGATGATGATGESAGPQPTSCAESVGAVSTLVPEAHRACNGRSASVESGDRLVGGDELGTSNSPSTVSFDLDVGGDEPARCNMSPDASAVIHPDAATDLKVLGGSVSCDVPAPATFEAPGATVTNKATLFSLTAAGDATTIRLYEGTVDVASSADGSVSQLSAGEGAGAACPVSASQAVVTTSEPMQQTAYTVDTAALTTTAIVKLRVGLVPPGSLAPLTGGMSTSKATILTGTDDQRKVLLDRALVRQVPVVTAAAVMAPPVEEQPIQAGETVLGVGSIPALLQSLCRIRADVPDAKLLYTPFTFPVTTTTDTGTTSTESGTTSTETGTDTTGTTTSP